MGQFTEQIQQITAAQNEILSERKRKQLKKERKEFSKYLFDKYKLKAIETIQPISQNAYNDILYNNDIINIFRDYNADLKKYNFDNFTIKFQSNELEKFIYKEISQQKSRYKKIELEEEKTQKEYNTFWKTDLYLLMDKKYKEYKNPYATFENCKYKLLGFYTNNNYTYKDIEFYDNLNKKFNKKYPRKQKINYLSAILLGIAGGLYSGYKANNKNNKKWRY